MDREYAVQLVQRAIKEHENLDQTKYALDYCIGDIGCDSLDVVEMILLVEEYIEVATKKQFSFANNIANGITTKSSIETLIKMVEQYGPTVSVSPSSKTI